MTVTIYHLTCKRKELAKRDVFAQYIMIVISQVRSEFQAVGKFLPRQGMDRKEDVPGIQAFEEKGNMADQ